MLKLSLGESGDNVTGVYKVTKVREDKPITERETCVLLPDETPVFDGNSACCTIPINNWFFY